jgi:hypothetical protein
MKALKKPMDAGRGGEACVHGGWQSYVFRKCDWNCLASLVQVRPFLCRLRTSGAKGRRESDLSFEFAAVMKY